MRFLHLQERGLSWKQLLLKLRADKKRAVAVILVNGTQIGTIALRDDQVDITGALHDGENEVTVRIYGTPKNLFGPHHAGRLRGSAWPGSFHGAPANTPPGSLYDVIPYGLFY